MIKVFNAIPQGDSCGWGVCGTQLARYMPDHCEIVGLIADADVVLMPVVNEKWDVPPECEWAWNIAMEYHTPVVGYGFHEFDIRGTQQIHWLPSHFTALACGSAWMHDWVKLALHEVAPDFPLSVVLQGVDKERFYYRPQEKPDFMKDRFVVASAGKFEFRKGQDVVIEAFRRFKKSVPEAMLMLNWDNPWPMTMLSMNASKWKHDLELIGLEGAVYVGGVDRNLIAPEDQVTWRIGQNADMPKFYQNADIAVFPNRCEAGTNLPLMEAIASGVPSVIHDATGQSDIADMLYGLSSCVLVDEGTKFKYPGSGDPVAHWNEPCVASFLSGMMKLYRDRPLEADRESLSHELDGLSWSKTAKGLVSLAESVLK